MDDGEIVMLPSSKLFVPAFSNYEEEAIRRERIVDEELRKEFEDLYDADDDSDYEFDWNSFEKSILLKMDNSRHMYIRPYTRSFNIYAEHSYAEVPIEWEEQTLPQKKSSCLSSFDKHPAEHSQTNYLEASDHLSEDVLNAKSSHEPTRDDSSSPHHSSSSGNIPAEHSQANDSKVSDRFSLEKDVSSIYSKDESALKKNELDWEDQYKILHVLFQNREEELKRVKNENTRLKNKIKCLQLKDSCYEAKWQKKVLQLKEKIDKLQESLDSKVETNFNSWPLVVLNWMWNRFTAAVPQVVTNLFPNLKTDAS